MASRSAANNEDSAEVRPLFGQPVDSDESHPELERDGRFDGYPQTDPRLARGFRWSDLVAEMEREHAARVSWRAA